MSQRTPSIRYCAYMLRCWHEEGHASVDAPGWRFSLEDPHTGVRRGFSSFELLLAFLRERLSSRPCDNNDSQADA